MIERISLPDIRSAKLKEWFTTNPVPVKEKSYISQLINKKASFGERAARRLEKDYGMPAYYLDSDEEMEQIIISSMSANESERHQYPIHLLDVKAKAGDTGYTNSQYPEIIESIYFSKDGLLEVVGRKSPERVEMITVPTDSMAPTISKGDIVFVDTSVNSYESEGIYIFLLEDELYIKRLQKIPGGIYKVLSDNDSYETFEITKEQIDSAMIMGKFIRVLPIKPQDL